MPSLPERPDLEQLKKRAKELLTAHRAGDESAHRRIQAHLPRLSNAPLDRVRQSQLSLSDAQLVIAREHGFPSWPKLKQHIESTRAADEDALSAFKDAVQAGDAARLRALFQRHPWLTQVVNEPLFAFDSPAIVVARNQRELVDVLLEHGADINARSRWWAGGFGVLDNVEPAMGAYLIERGAVVDVHAAAGLGLLDRLAELIADDPALVNAKGGDGQRPLHFARSLEVVDFLLDHGAEIDARDVDHEGTPAQWAVPPPPGEGDPAVRAAQIAKCRHLIRRGAQPDIFMACALGELDLVRAVLASDPAAISARVGDGRYAPVPDAPGGHIYTYSLGSNVSPHQVAARFGHRDVEALLFEHSPPKERFLAACARGDGPAVQELLAAHPHLVASLAPHEARLIADAAWDGDLAAVRVMIDAGFDPHTVRDAGMTALHCAAFHGFVDVVRFLLERDPHPPLTVRNEYGGTPLGTCIAGSTMSWRNDGDHAATAEALIAAGSPLPPQAGGSDAVAAVLRRHGVPG